MAFTRARTKLACEVVGIDRQKLNDAINSGDYSCAPETTPGRARIFDIDDMAALFVYERLTQRGTPSRRAGGVACRVLAAMRSHPGSKRIVIGWSMSGSAFVTPEESWNSEARSVAPGQPLFNTEIYDVENVREIIRRRLEEESTIGGEDDE